MITIHGVPLSVHTRKAIVTAILKKIDYKFEVVIPVVPGNPPPNWRELSPTGLIPVMQDGDFTLADSTAICLYLEKVKPSPAILPGNPATLPGDVSPSDARAYGRALWFDAYAGGTIFRHVVGPLFHETIVGPHIHKAPVNKAAIDHVLNEVQVPVLNYLESQIDGRFLVGETMTLADIAIASNFIIYQYIGYKIDAARYPKLVKYLRGITQTEAFRKALDDEKPFVANMGLDRSFLD